jgi:TctA family transporter
MIHNNTFDLFGSCLVGLCFLAIFILTLVAMFWVYQDAEKRGKTGCLWLLLISATGPLGIIAYLVLRDREVKL